MQALDRAASMQLGQLICPLTCFGFSRSIIRTRVCFVSGCRFCAATEENLIMRLRNDDEEFLTFTLCRAACRQSCESPLGARPRRACSKGCATLAPQSRRLDGPFARGRVFQKALGCALCVESFTNDLCANYRVPERVRDDWSAPREVLVAFPAADAVCRHQPLAPKLPSNNVKRNS